MNGGPDWFVVMNCMFSQLICLESYLEYFAVMLSNAYQLVLYPHNQVMSSPVYKHCLVQDTELYLNLGSTAAPTSDLSSDSPNKETVSLLEVNKINHCNHIPHAIEIAKSIQ